MQCLPRNHVAIGFVRCFVQHKETQLGVMRHVLLNELGVVCDVPAVGRCRRYYVPHGDFATGQHARVSTELLVLHDGNVCLLDSILYVHDSLQKI